MITINGNKFAKNEKEFQQSLLSLGGTAYGYYKKLKNRIELMDNHGNLFAAIIVNKPNFCGIVNACKVDNKKFYQYAASEITRELLGVPNGYGAGIDYAEFVYKNALQEHAA